MVDPTNQGSVGALEAAKFLKKSGLSDAVLSKVWDLSDPNGKGYLNKAGFFVALKLVSLAQAGKDLNITNVSLDMLPPKMGDMPTTIQNNIINSVPATLSDWAMKPSERAKYEQLFDSLQPLNGVIPGNRVKGLLIDSKLPVDTLGKIWDLADMDKDGSLDRHEFVVAMHLVYKALEKYAIPNCLPPELLPPGKRKDSVPSAPVIPVIPIVPVIPVKETVQPIIPVTQTTWVVSADERAKYEIMFLQADVDKDGYVSGQEIKDVFLQSGVPQNVLAHIWGLCDTKQTGKLNREQFALAMWMINQKLKGIDPPHVLTTEMIPPSLRTNDGIVENNNTTLYSNPELDMISKDIEELVREKQILEGDILQKEADIKIKSGEVKSLQGELDTLAATLKQLETQKGEAQKRLNDLKNQVDSLRRQAEEQEASLKVQEEELANKKQELEGLKQEESKLEQQQNEFKERLETLSQSLQESQLQISQVKASISHLQEHQRQMRDAIALSESAISSGDSSTVPDTCLNLQPEFREPSYTRLTNDEVESNKDPFSNLNGPADSGGDKYEHNDAFKHDPFRNTTNTADPFSSNDKFTSGFTTNPSNTFSSDPFNSFGNSIGKTDPFDPFHDSSSHTEAKNPDDLAGKDPFGCDPFASLHPPAPSGAPPPRPESPSPALPPKKSKQPPPRPAPPRPLQPPTPSPDPFTSTTQVDDPFSAFNNNNNNNNNDPFASSDNTTATSGFADFANFNSKFSDTTGDNRVAAAAVTRLDFTEDPFRDYRYEDPFNIADPFDDVPTIHAAPDGSRKLDPFGIELCVPAVKVSGKSTPVSGKATPLNGKGTPSPLLSSEDQELAWAAAESLRLEEERLKQIEQERHDLELALALSKKEKKRTDTLTEIIS